MAQAELKTREELQHLIEASMPLPDFLRILGGIRRLKREEELKLAALRELQQSYLAAGGDGDRDLVKEMVGKIRELSKADRAELRAFHQELMHRNIPVELANQWYDQMLALESAPTTG